MRRFIEWLGGWEPLPELPPRSSPSFIFGLDDDEDRKRLRTAEDVEDSGAQPRRSRPSEGRGDPLSRDSR
jgi:hypothetical protein